MESLVKTKNNCNLRRINVQSWGSDVAKQHGIQGLPTLWLYDGTNRVSQNGSDVMQRVSRLE